MKIYRKKKAFIFLKILNFLIISFYVGGCGGSCIFIRHSFIDSLMKKWDFLNIAVS